MNWLSHFADNLVLPEDSEFGLQHALYRLQFHAKNNETQNKNHIANLRCYIFRKSDLFFCFFWK